jgi:hypothetical protein
MTRVWNKFHQVVSSEKIEKPNNLKVLGEKPNGQNRITKRSWFSPGTPVSFTNKTDCHDITEMLSKVALSIITLSITTFL